MAGNENNPYAIDQQKKTKPGDPDHIVTREDLEAHNHKGDLNPAKLNKNRSDDEIMSGKRDHAGIPMDMAQAQATESNDALLAKMVPDVTENWQPHSLALQRHIARLGRL